MKRWHKIAALVAICVLAVSGLAWGSDTTRTIEVSYPGIHLVVHGQEVQTPKEPFVYDGSTYVPLRVVAEALGETVKWDGETNTIFIGNATALHHVAIASMSPVSGGSASLGVAIMNGAAMAIADDKPALAQAGFAVDFLAMDDQGRPDLGTQLAEQLRTKHDVLGIVGPLNSGVAIPASQALAADDLVMVSPANTNPRVTERGLPNYDRLLARDDKQPPAAVRFVAQQLKAQRLFIVHDDSTFGQRQADGVRRTAEFQGLTVDGEETIRVGDTNFTSVVSDIKVAGSPLVYYGGLYAEAARLVREMRDQGVSAAFIGPDGLDDAALVKLAGDAANGVYYTSAIVDVRRTPAGADFARRYEAFSQQPFDNFAAYSYDAAQVILQALLAYARENPNQVPTRQDLATRVRHTAAYHGVATDVTFDAKGDNQDAVIPVYQIQNGTFPGVQVQ